MSFRCTECTLFYQGTGPVCEQCAGSMPPPILRQKAVPPLSGPGVFTLRAGQKEVDPPLLIQKDGALKAFDLKPGALNYAPNSDLESAIRGLDDAFLEALWKMLAPNHPRPNFVPREPPPDKIAIDPYASMQRVLR